MPGRGAAAAATLFNGEGSQSLAVATSASVSSVDSIRRIDSKDGFYLEKGKVRDMMRDWRFDFAIGVVIMSNCFTIGLEQSWDLEGKSTVVLAWLEHVFLTIYIIEIGLRFFGYGIHCLEDNWVKFDLLLVLIGIVTGWILPPILGSVSDSLGPLMVLRTARLMRLARTVRLLVKFRELWMLVRGLLNSASTMFYTMLMLFIIIYLFSCMSIEIITNHTLARGSDADPEFKEFVQEHFRNLPLTMMTLLQFASLDNMNLIYMPLVKKSWWLAFFFIAIILVISIALMNLITAVVVNSALEQAMSDKEAMKAHEDKKRKKLMKEVKKLFISLDDDGSGCVSREEMECMKPEDRAIFQKILGTSDPMEVFMQLDVDGSGELEIDEFCDGIYQAAASKVPFEFKRLERQVASLKKIIEGSTERMEILLELLHPGYNSLGTFSPSGNGTNGKNHAGNDFMSEGSGTEKSEKGSKASKASKASRVHGIGGIKLDGLSRQTSPGIPEKPSNVIKDCVLDSLVSWQTSLSIELEKLNRPLNQQLQEISSQLDQVLLEAKVGNAQHGAVPSKGQSAWSVFPSHHWSQLGICCQSDEGKRDHAEVPRWAEDLRKQLLSTAEAIRRQQSVATAESSTVLRQDSCIEVVESPGRQKGKQQKSIADNQVMYL